MKKIKIMSLILFVGILLSFVNISFGKYISPEGDDSEGDTYMETGESYYAENLDIILPVEGNLGSGSIYQLNLFDSDGDEIGSYSDSGYWAGYTSNRDDVEYITTIFLLSIPVNMPVTFLEDSDTFLSLEPGCSESITITTTKSSTISYYAELAASWVDSLVSTISATYFDLLSASLVKSITATISAELGWTSTESTSITETSTTYLNNDSSSIEYYRGETRGLYDAYITAEYELASTSSGSSLYDKYELLDTFYDYNLADEPDLTTGYNRYYYSSKKSAYLLYDYADDRTDEYFFDA